MKPCYHIQLRPEKTKDQTPIRFAFRENLIGRSLFSSLQHRQIDRQTHTGKRASGVRESDPGPGRGTRADRGNLRRSAASQSRLASLFHNLTSDCLWPPLRCRLAARPTGNSLYLCSLQARSAGTRQEKGWATFPENFDREQCSVLTPVESRLVLVKKEKQEVHTNKLNWGTAKIMISWTWLVW